MDIHTILREDPDLAALIIEEEKRQKADEDVTEKETAADTPEELAQRPTHGHGQAVKREGDADQGREEGSQAEQRAWNAHLAQVSSRRLIEHDRAEGDQPDDEEWTTPASSLRFGIRTRRQHAVLLNQEGIRRNSCQVVKSPAGPG